MLKVPAIDGSEAANRAVEHVISLEKTACQSKSRCPVQPES